MFDLENVKRAFLRRMCSGPRRIAVTGHFGSGKTEFAVSLVLAMAEAERRTPSGLWLSLCDLDIENPYFRSRERQGQLEAAGIRVYSDPFQGRNASELQTISAAIRGPLEAPDCRCVLDCGGDGSGAMVLNQFRKYFTLPDQDYRLLCLVNRNRPGTDTVEKATGHIQAIEQATGLTVTGLISNAHLVRETSLEDVVQGWTFTRETAERTGIPALCACCMDTLAQAVAETGIPVFPIGMYMRESYLDKQV